MAEKKVKESTLKKLRERGVKPKSEVLEMSKEQRKVIREIKDCLKDGPKTIPEIASKLNMPTGVITWYVMTLVKYGELTHSEEEVDGYFLYSLPEKEKKG